MSEVQEEKGIYHEEEQQRGTELERLKLYLNFGKFIATLFFGTVLGTTLSWFVNYKEVQIKEKESRLKLQLDDRKELEKYFTYTLGGDVYQRLNLSIFFENVLSDQDSRNLWRSYKESQEVFLEDFRRLNIEIYNIDRQLGDERLSEVHEELKEKKIEIEYKLKNLKELVKPVKPEIKSRVGQVKEGIGGLIIFNKDPGLNYYTDAVSAEFEVKLAKDKLNKESIVIKIGDFYYTAIEYVSVEEAKNNLERVKKELNKKSAYIELLSELCKIHEPPKSKVFKVGEKEYKYNLYVCID